MALYSGKNYWTQNVCFDILLQSLCEVFLILRRVQWDKIIILRGSSFKLPGILIRLHGTLNVFDMFSKNTDISSFIKIRPVGAELFYADRQTDRQTDVTKLVVAFLNFAKALKKFRLSSTVITLVIIIIIIIIIIIKGRLGLFQSHSENTWATYRENLKSRNYRNQPYWALYTYCGKYWCKSTID